MLENKYITILISILAVIAVSIGIYFYNKRENMTCELITNSDYIRKNFRSMMDSPQIVRPQNRVRSLMRSNQSTSNNYILLAMNFFNPISSNFSVDIIGENNSILYKSSSVTQDINGSLILFETETVDFSKMRSLKLNNFDSNQNRVTRVVFGKYENNDITLEPVSRCFIQYDSNTKSTNIVPILNGIQSLKLVAQKSGKIGQLVVRGDLNADITSTNITANGVTDLNNLLDGTNSKTQANVNVNGSINLNTLRQRRQALTYVDEIILRNVNGLFPVIISFNYGKYIFDLVYNPNVELDVYNIKAQSMTPIYDYDINALRISFNAILTKTSEAPPEPIRTCDKTNFTVVDAPMCENINGVWKRKQTINYQDSLCQNESKYIDCPSNMIPSNQTTCPINLEDLNNLQNTLLEKDRIIQQLQSSVSQKDSQIQQLQTNTQNTTCPEQKVCPINENELLQLVNRINNLESTVSQKDFQIRQLQTDVSNAQNITCPTSQSCPISQEQYNQTVSNFNNLQSLLTQKDSQIQQLQTNLSNAQNITCPITQEQYDQAILNFNNLQSQLEQKINDYNTLQDNLFNNYIDKATYDQQVASCAQDITNITQLLIECESKLNSNTP